MELPLSAVAASRCPSTAAASPLTATEDYTDVRDPMRHFRAFGSGAGSLKRVARSPSASALKTKPSAVFVQSLRERATMIAVKASAATLSTLSCDVSRTSQLRFMPVTRALMVDIGRL
ncbi:unnamed protein product [Lampetra planeri]